VTQKVTRWRRWKSVRTRQGAPLGAGPVCPGKPVIVTDLVVSGLAESHLNGQTVKRPSQLMTN